MRVFGKDFEDAAWKFNFVSSPSGPQQIVRLCIHLDVEQLKIAYNLTVPADIGSVSLRYR